MGGPTTKEAALSYCIGVDVGGTTCTIALGDSDRRVVHVSDQFATHAAEGPDSDDRGDRRRDPGRTGKNSVCDPIR